MASQIGEMFISLGVKGSDKTVAAFTNIKSSISDVTSMSLEAKAAILGAMYAIEQMTSASGHNAQGLVNLHETLGMGIETLERYRYAASLAGASNEEMDSSFQSIQQTMAEYRRTGKAPLSLSFISSATGGLDYDRIAKQDWAYLLQKYQEFAKSGVPKDQIVLSLKQMGLSGGVISALMRNLFQPDILAKAPITSEKTIRALDQMQRRFTDLEAHFNRMRDRFLIKWGPELAQDLQQILPHLERLTTAFMRLMEVMKPLHLMSKIFDGWAQSMDVISNATEALSGDKNKQKGIWDSFQSLLQNPINPNASFTENAVMGSAMPYLTLGHFLQDGLMNSGLSVIINQYLAPGTDAQAMKRAAQENTSAIQRTQQKSQNRAAQQSRGNSRGK